MFVPDQGDWYGSTPLTATWVWSTQACQQKQVSSVAQREKINKSSNPSCSHQREDGCTEWNVHIWPICFSFFYFSFISTWSSVPLTEFWNWVYVPVPNLWLLPHPLRLEKDLRLKMSKSHVNPRKKCILKCSFSTSLLILVTYDSH